LRCADTPKRPENTDRIVITDGEEGKRIPEGRDQVMSGTIQDTIHDLGKNLVKMTGRLRKLGESKKE
jgi:hypothetical protein